MAKVNFEQLKDFNFVYFVDGLIDSRNCLLQWEELYNMPSHVFYSLCENNQIQTSIYIDKNHISKWIFDCKRFIACGGDLANVTPKSNIAKPRKCEINNTYDESLCDSREEFSSSLFFL